MDVREGIRMSTLRKNECVMFTIVNDPLDTYL